MKRFILILLSLSLSIFLFVIYKNLSNDEELYLKKSNFSLIKNEEFFKSNPKEELEGNIYIIQVKSKQYIIFYEMNINPNNIQVNIEDTIIKIKLTDDYNYKDIYVYEINNSKNYEDYTLKIIKTDKELQIKAIIL
ncbi:hypothetical protein [Clostridium sp. B9]|uniref:hypothetical protein n=1 Tax=Clostridium sp. B9 TaxID=3423224 RepID=UPI003D2ED236